MQKLIRSCTKHPVNQTFDSKKGKSEQANKVNPNKNAEHGLDVTERNAGYMLLIENKKRNHKRRKANNNDVAEVVTPRDFSA